MQYVFSGKAAAWHNILILVHPYKMKEKLRRYSKPKQEAPGELQHRIAPNSTQSLSHRIWHLIGEVAAWAITPAQKQRGRER